MKLYRGTQAGQDRQAAANDSCLTPEQPQDLPKCTLEGTRHKLLPGNVSIRS